MARPVLKSLARRLSIVLVAALALTGCEVSNPGVRVLLGNYAYGRGNYQQALVHYLIGAESAEQDEWFSYNIGNVYHALGENEAALQMWSVASRSSDLNLQFGTSFNRGVLFYETGRYEQAYDSFVHALTINSASRDAKVNLELALAKLRAEDTANQPQQAPGIGPGEQGAGQETMRIIEYVRRKEEQQWTANRQPGSATHPRDW